MLLYLEVSWEINVDSLWQVCHLENMIDSSQDSTATPLCERGPNPMGLFREDEKGQG